MFMDLALARRLEATEGAICKSYVEPRRRVSGVPAAVLERDGTIAMFDGVDSPLSQTFGLGVYTAATPELLGELEEFFLSRGCDVMHEVSPFGGVDTFALLAARGYAPIELSTVLVQPIREAAAPATQLAIRELDRDDDRDCAAWVDTCVEGWATEPGIAEIIRPIAQVNVANRATSHYVVERDGARVATGSLAIHGEVALFAGASTVPSARGLGAQAILLAKRLADAKRRGCTVAMMVASVGSTSQRNAERRGFRVAYTRVKWRLPKR
jgi:GNAT superfamily N-acetyltransferase